MIKEVMTVRAECCEGTGLGARGARSSQVGISCCLPRGRDIEKRRFEEKGLRFQAQGTAVQRDRSKKEAQE